MMEYKKSVDYRDSCVKRYLNNNNNIFWTTIQEIVKKHNCEYILHQGKYTNWLDFAIFSENVEDVTNCANELDLVTNLCMDTHSNEIWVRYSYRDWSHSDDVTKLIFKNGKSKSDKYYFVCCNRIKLKYEILSLEDGVKLLQSILPSNQFRFVISNGKTQMDKKSYDAIVVHDITLKYTQIKALTKVIKTEEDTYFQTTMGNYISLSDIKQAQDFPTWI